MSRVDHPYLTLLFPVYAILRNVPPLTSAPSHCFSVLFPSVVGPASQPLNFIKGTVGASTECVFVCVLCVCLCALIGGQSEGWGATCTLLESAHTHINACRGFTLGKQTKTRVKAWSAASLAPRQCVFSPQHKLKRQLLPKPILKCYKSRGSFISHTSALFAIWCHVSAHTNCLCVFFF